MTCWAALASIVLSASHGFYLEVNIGGGGGETIKHNSAKAPVFHSGKNDQMVSASSVLELEVNQNMFLNPLTHTYM